MYFITVERVGTENKIVRVLAGVKLGSCVQVKAGAMIGEDAQITDLKTVARNIRKHTLTYLLCLLLRT